uniref:C-type lectin domain-containing protein n=1 Tax=Anabas testudineus TaxID=64144 RepID=A0A3Q1H8S8_ANATE
DTLNQSDDMEEDLPAGVSRFRPWLFPAATAAVILILIIAVGASNTKMSNRLWSVEQRASNLSSVVQSLNTSLQTDFMSVLSVLCSVSDALKQLSVVDTLEKSVASLKCSLERIINNSSVSDGCCPLGWDLFSSSCYFFSPSELNWNDSRDWCVKQEAHLVILKTDKEWDFVTKRTIPDFYWVGLTDGRTGKWEWVNQTPYTMERRYITCDSKTVCATSARNTVCVAKYTVPAKPLWIPVILESYLLQMNQNLLITWTLLQFKDSTFKCENSCLFKFK